MAANFPLESRFYLNFGSFVPISFFEMCKEGLRQWMKGESQRVDEGLSISLERLDPSLSTPKMGVKAVYNPSHH